MKLLHLHHDIMNLYGDYANISALTRIFGNSSIDCTVDKRSLADEVDLRPYDFIYIGSGTEKNRNVVMADMQKYKEALREKRDSGTPILLTGNAFEMLGQSVTDAARTAPEGLGLYDFPVTEQNKTRTTSDAILTASFSDKPLVGFINKCSEIEGIHSPLFTVQMGLGNNSHDKYEGLHDHCLFGTHLTGPVLIKNPHFLIYLAQQIAGEKASISVEYLTYENAAYQISLHELQQRKESTTVH